MAAAARARAHYEQGKPPLLDEEKTSFAEAKPATATLATAAKARSSCLKRLATAHGAKVNGPLYWLSLQYRHCDATIDPL